MHAPTRHAPGDRDHLTSCGPVWKRKDWERMTSLEPTPDTDPLRERLQRALGSQYSLGRELGGGMSRVFLAEETALDRKVVVKVLSTSLIGEVSSERFAREIRLSARLQHPGIVPVLSVGTADALPYYVMPYVAGESLRHRLAQMEGGHRLPLAQAIAILRDVARALAFAHGQGVIHRDIKPENILLSGDAAVVADFGVAKALRDARTKGDLVSPTTLTQAGTSLGTPAYMSPEQAAGDPSLDARSDIYAFGVVAYEMLAGEHPFAHRHSIHALVAAHLMEAPRPLETRADGVPQDLAAVVMRCLAKSPEDRPASAEILVDVLTSGRDSPTAATVQSTNGTAIAGRSALRRPVLITIGVALIAGGALIAWWGLGRMDRGEKVVSSMTANSAGYGDYMRGRVKDRSENREDNHEAIRYLRLAVAADPNLAPAYAELARAYTLRAFYYAPDSERKSLSEDAEIAVDRALTLQPDLADAWFVKGFMLWTPSRRFPHDQAIAAYRRALSLNSQLDEAHHQLALVLLHVGLLDEARAHIDSALAINPLNTLARFRYGVIASYRGDYSEADRIFRSTQKDLNPSLWGFQEANALLRLGRTNEASALLSRFLAENPKDEGGVGHSVLAMIGARAGRRTEADSAISRAVSLGGGFGHFHHTAYNIAVAETMLGRKSAAIKYLEQAADDGFPCYPLFATDIDLAVLRSEPRFIALLARLKADMERLRVGRAGA